MRTTFPQQQRHSSRQSQSSKMAQISNSQVSGATSGMPLFMKQDSAIQTKLTVNPANDIYEQEADRFADQVMTMPDTATQQSIQPETKPLSITPLVQRETLLEEKSIVPIVQHEIELEQKENPAPIKSTSDGGLQTGADLEVRLNNSKGEGNPLPGDVRSFMEPRFGADFSQVRVHTGSEAAQMNQNLNARAFTHQQDIYFGDTSSPSKDALMAHELTHVVQQMGTVTRPTNLGLTQAQHNSIQCDRPDIHHDHGFLDDGHGNIDETKRRTATLSDYASLAWWTAKLNGAEIIRPDLIDGTAAYRHFLNGNGATRTIDYERFIENDQSGQTIITSAADDILGLARDRHNQILRDTPSATETQTFHVQTGAIPVGNTGHYPYPATENWQKAIGAHVIWLEGDVTVNIDAINNTRSFEIRMTLNMEDMYNFNPGAQDIATRTPDAANGQFELTGLGHEYLNTGTAHRTISSPPEPMDTINSNAPNPSVEGPRLPSIPTPDDGRGTGRRQS